MLINEIEDDIITRLNSKLTDIKATAFPERPSEYYLKSQTGAVLVRYDGSKYGALISEDPVHVQRTVSFEITVVYRHLKSHVGVYGYLDVVRTTLTGHKPLGLSKMYPLREEFIGEASGIWQYGISFAMKVPTLEIEEDLQEALLQRITGLNQFGDIPKVF